MVSPHDKGWLRFERTALDFTELEYNGCAAKKQEPRRPDLICLTTGRGSHMTRTILIAALLGLSGVAYAQDLTAEQRSACMGDYEKFCKGIAPGGGRIIACLSKSSDKLTAECKKVLTAAEKK
jgi:hypothetical protein